MLLFAKDGFRPQVVLTTGSQSERTVVMQPETEVSLALPSCREHSTEAFPELELAKTPRIGVRRGGDVDFRGYAATYTKNPAVVEVLGSMTGIHVGGLNPTPDWVKGLSSLTVRSIRCGGMQWIDLRGVSEGGLLQSRWVGYGQGHVDYSKVSREAALAFDHAIDHGCCLCQ